MVTEDLKLQDACSLEEKTDLDNVLKSRDIILLTKVYLVKDTVFSSSHVQMWELDHKEGWVLKNRCFQVVVLEKNLARPLNSKEIKPVNPKGNQHCIFIERTDAEAPIFRPPEVNNQLIEKDPGAGKDWRWKEKGATEDEMVRYCHRLSVEKKMATHSSVVARRIPGTAEPGGLPSMGSHRVGHNWSNLAVSTLWFHLCKILGNNYCFTVTERR